MTVSERGLEDRREDPREHDRERQHQGDRDDERRNTRGDPARHDLLVDDDDDRAVRQVQAVGRPAEVAERPRFEQAKKRGRPAGRQPGEKTRDRRSQREVDPEQVVERPHRALPPDHREHGRGGGGREPGPRPRPASPARAHDAGGHDADREQRGEVGRRLDHEDVQAGDVRAEDAHCHHEERHGGEHDEGAPPAHHQQQQRERDVQLGLDGDRPERSVGARRADEVLQEQAVDDDGLRVGHALSRRSDDEPRDREAEARGRPSTPGGCAGPAAARTGRHRRVASRGGQVPGPARSRTAR